MFGFFKKRPLMLAGVRNAAGVFAYVVLIGSLMINGDRLFGRAADIPILAMVAFLMTFVVSALVTALLALGQPIALYLRGHRSEGAYLLLYTGLGMAAFTFLSFVALAAFSR